MRFTLIFTVGGALRRLRSEQSGQSLILVSVAMGVALGFSAISIDVASWYQKHHQAQVVADSAALAAANCLANPGVGPTGDVCNSSTDVSDAQQVAVNYAAMNGVQISTSNVSINTSTDTVKVTASSTSPTFFSRLIGIKTTTQSAGSTAGWSSGAATACTSAEQSAGQCYAIYTQDPGCGSTDGWQTGSTNETITGAIHSQGTINFGSGGGQFTFNGPITYSSNNCSVTVPQNSLPMKAQSPTAGDNQASTYWPLNYATVFPACSTTAGTCTTTAAAAANGNLVAGAPSYCTYATTSSSGFTFGWINNVNQEPISGNVYCSIGTGPGVNVSDPATWNGPITFTNGASAGSSGNPVAVTMIGGHVNASGTSPLYLSPAVSNCLVYAVDTDAASGSDAIEFGNGNYSLGGTMFAPNGTINLNSTSATAAFLEAQKVDTVNLSFQGDGPVVSGSGGAGSGSGPDYLTQ
jgi:hypothetical protein